MPSFLVNDKGERHAVRYVMAPEKLVHLTAEEAAKTAPDFLINELPARVARGPVTFHLKSQLASPGDSTKDASIPWPKSNEVVELGVLTIDKTVPDSLEAQKKLLFLPGQLIEGIERSDDPLIGVRDGAYAVSFSRRNPDRDRAQPCARHAHLPDFRAKKSFSTCGREESAITASRQLGFCPLDIWPVEVARPSQRSLSKAPGI